MLTPGALAQTDQDHSDEYNLPWALEAIKADAAYQYFLGRGLPLGGDGVVIAISDAGIDGDPLAEQSAA